VKEQSSAITNLYKDFQFFHSGLNDRMNRLAEVVGERSDSDDSSSNDLP
jgi:hypothetical protein